MKTFCILLLAAGKSSCAPPLELDPVTTTAPWAQETTTNLATDLTTTDVPTVETTTTERLYKLLPRHLLQLKLLLRTIRGYHWRKRLKVNIEQPIAT